MLYEQIDVYELTPERVGRFDLVHFFEVLCHLKHLLLALERVCALTTEFAAVAWFILREEHRPASRAWRRHTGGRGGTSRARRKFGQ